MARESISGCG